jgi:hypothetical protein
MSSEWCSKVSNEDGGGWMVYERTGVAYEAVVYEAIVYHCGECMV